MPARIVAAALSRQQRLELSGGAFLFLSFPDRARFGHLDRGCDLNLFI